ncbi:MAG: chemotaxis protein CheW [Candidatus Heimdallarchaeota archaeon]|nr:chemotaxis protein CheW [Candidatus Heimdallarchaeota archaeon]
MAKYAKVKYDRNYLLIGLDQDHTFAPMNYLIQPVKNLPEYCLGMINFEGNASIILDTAKMLDIESTTQDTIVLHTFTNVGNITLIISLPEVIDIDEKDLPSYKMDPENLILPSGKYVIYDDETYLYFSLFGLQSFIAKEIDGILDNKWKEVLPTWGDTTLVLSERTLTIPSSTKMNISYSDIQETVLCKISDYVFSFNQKYSIELLSNLPVVTKLPNSPIWVEGVFDYSGETLALVNLHAYFGMKNQEESQLVLVISNDSKERIALLVDQVSIIKDVQFEAMQHEIDLDIDGFLFRNITVNDQNEFTFHLDVNVLSDAVNGKIISKDWETWLTYFNNNKDQTTNNLRKGVVLSRQTKKFAIIKYNDQNLLFDVGDEYALHSVVDTTPLTHLPDYCEGMGNINSDPVLVINLAKMLGISDTAKDRILLHTQLVENDRYAFNIPIPEIQDLEIDDIDDSLVITKDISLVSSRYILYQEEIFLRITKSALFAFIQDNIASTMSKFWMENILEFHTSVTITSDMQPQKSIRKMEISTIADYNTLVSFRLGSTYFSFNEKYFLELTSFHYELSRVPNASEYVVGIINYQQDAVPIINLSRMIGETLDLSDPLILLFTINKGNYAILLDNDSFERINVAELTKTMEDDTIGQHLISNIYFDEARIFYNLDLDALTQWVYKRQYYDPKYFRSLLSIDRKQYNELGSVLQQKTDDTEQKYAVFSYPELHIVIELDLDYSLQTTMKAAPFDLLPDFCDGFINIRNSPAVMIDFAKMLNIKDTKEEHVLLVANLDENQVFAFNIPVPSIHNVNLRSERESIDDELNMISSHFIEYDNQVHLKFTQHNLLQFINRNIRETLTTHWKKFTPTWQSFVQPRSDEFQFKKSSKMLGSVAISDSDSIISFVVGKYKLSVEENNFFQLITRNQELVRAPNASNHVLGIMNYQQQDIPLLDLNSIFGGSNTKTDLVMLLEFEGRILGIPVETSQYKSSKKSEYQIIETHNKNIHISEIYFSEEEIIYSLNLRVLSNWIWEEAEYNPKDWQEYLSFSESQYSELSDKVLEEKEEQQYVAIKVPDYIFMIQSDKILQIRGRGDREQIMVDGVRFVNYDDQWIPSIEIYKKLENPISIVIQNGDFLMELITNYAYFEHIDEVVLKEDTFNALYMKRNYFGTSKAYVVGDDVAFDLNFDSLLSNVLKKESKEIEKIKKTISKPVPEIEKGDSELLQIWQDDVTLLLIIETKDGSKSAIRVDNIRELRLEIEGDYIPWEGSEEEFYYYLSITNSNNKEEYYQIPVNCRLKAIPIDFDGQEIDLDDEPVKIITLKAKK